MNVDGDYQTLAELAFSRLLGSHAGDCIVSPWSLSFVSELAESWSQITEEAWLQQPAQGSKQGACVKTFRPCFFLNVKGALRSFLQEVQRLHQLHHRHLVHIIGVGCYNNQTWLSLVASTFMVEEYAGPMTLARLITAYQLAPDEPAYGYTYADALRWMIQLADVLAFLHAQGVSHGDVRCHNLFFTVPDVHRTDIRLADLKPHRHTYRQDLRSPVPHKQLYSQAATSSNSPPHDSCLKQRRAPSPSTPTPATKQSSYPQECLRHFNEAHSREPLLRSSTQGHHAVNGMPGDSCNSLEGHVHATNTARAASRGHGSYSHSSIADHEQKLLEQAGKHAADRSPLLDGPLARASWSVGIGPTMRNLLHSQSPQECSPSPSHLLTPGLSPFLASQQRQQSFGKLETLPPHLKSIGYLPIRLSAPLTRNGSLQASRRHIALQALGSGHLMSAASRPEDAHVLADLAAITAVNAAYNTRLVKGGYEGITRSSSSGLLRYSFSVAVPRTCSPVGGSPIRAYSITGGSSLGVLPEGVPLDINESNLNLAAPDAEVKSVEAQGTPPRCWAKGTLEGRNHPIMRVNTPPRGVARGDSAGFTSPMLSASSSLNRQLMLEHRTSSGGGFAGGASPPCTPQGCDMHAVLQALTPITASLPSAALGMGSGRALGGTSTSFTMDLPQVELQWKPLLTPLVRPHMQQPGHAQLLQRTSLPPVLPLPEALATLDAGDPVQRAQHAEDLKQQVADVKDQQHLNGKHATRGDGAHQAGAGVQRSSAPARTRSHGRGGVPKSVSFASRPADNKLPGCALSCMTAPPEAMKDPAAACTPAADVFAFGQVMYETFMRSVMVPAGDSDDAQWKSIQAHVAAAAHGKRSPLPNYWPSKLTSVLQSCWATHPKDRPSMSTILHKLRALRSDVDFQRALMFADRTHTSRRGLEQLKTSQQHQKDEEEVTHAAATQGCGCTIS